MSTGVFIEPDFVAILPGVASSAPVIRVGIVMNGVTGRMGTHQHLGRSIAAIRAEGGVPLLDGRLVWPDPILVGRNEDKLRRLAEEYRVDRWTTDLDAALSDPSYEVYFDAQTTARRPEGIAAAIAAGKHVYCEKPLAPDVPTALELVRLAAEAGIKNGIVQDKLFLPGLLKLRKLVDNGFFGRILSVRGEFGYWVFEGIDRAGQRPSWNYRSEDGGGIILDMFAHWQYVLENLFGRPLALCCLGTTHIPERVDEAGKPYAATADDAAYAIFELEGGVIAQFNSSWAVRVYRDDLLTIQVDGTDGSAVAGLRRCVAQDRSATPRAVWNPDIDDPIEYRRQWQDIELANTDNAFKHQWAFFLRHVVSDEPYDMDFLAGAKGVQLAELAVESSRRSEWLDIPGLSG